MTAGTERHHRAEPSAATPGPVASRGPVSSYTDLARTVRSSGLLDRRRGYYLTRIGVLGLALTLVVLGVVIVGDSWWQLLLAPLLAVVVTQFAFLGHDAAHRQIFTSGPRNDTAARIFSGLVVGLAYGWWLGKHNVHHAAPNQIGRDTDIESKLLAFYPRAAHRLRRGHRWMLAHQGFALFPLLLLEGFNLHFDSLRTLTTRKTAQRVTRGATRTQTRQRALDIALFVLHWATYLSVTTLTMSAGKAAAFIAIDLACLGVLLGGAFVPNHTGMPVLERGARIDFLHRQVLASRNVSGGWFLEAMMGGLNRQVEHHLFPSMPRPNLRRVQPLVRQFCRDNDVHYTETTFSGAFADVVRYLNAVGIAARRGNTCPLAEQLRS